MSLYEYIYIYIYIFGMILFAYVCFVWFISLGWGFEFGALGPFWICRDLGSRVQCLVFRV